MHFSKQALEAFRFLLRYTRLYATHSFTNHAFHARIRVYLRLLMSSGYEICLWRREAEGKKKSSLHVNNLLRRIRLRFVIEFIHA